MYSTTVYSTLFQEKFHHFLILIYDNLKVFGKQTGEKTNELKISDWKWLQFLGYFNLHLYSVIKNFGKVQMFFVFLGTWLKWDSNTIQYKHVGRHCYRRKEIIHYVIQFAHAWSPFRYLSRLSFSQRRIADVLYTCLPAIWSVTYTPDAPRRRILRLI